MTSRGERNQRKERERCSLVSQATCRHLASHDICEGSEASGEEKAEHQTESRNSLANRRVSSGVDESQTSNDCVDEKQWNELLERCFRIQEMIEMPQICTGEMWCNCKHVPFEDAS